MPASAHESRPAASTVVGGRAPYDRIRVTFEETSSAPFTRRKQKLEDTRVFLTCDTLSAKIIIEDIGPDLVNRKLWTGTKKQ